MSFLTTHCRVPLFPIKGTLALHCQVARFLSKSFPSAGSDRVDLARRHNKILL